MFARTTHSRMTKPPLMKTELDRFPGAQCRVQMFELHLGRYYPAERSEMRSVQHVALD